MSVEQLKELRKLAEDLNHAADTAALMLKTAGYPAAGQSLDQHVARMKIFLETPPKVKTYEYSKADEVKRLLAEIAVRQNRLAELLLPRKSTTVFSEHGPLGKGLT